MATQTLSTVQACEAADITYRQLDYWTRAGYFPGQKAAPGSGSRRRWNAHEVAIATVLGRLAPFIPINRLAALAGLLHAQPVDAWPDVLVIDQDGQPWHPGDDAPPVGIHVDLRRLVALAA